MAKISSLFAFLLLALPLGAVDLTHLEAQERPTPAEGDRNRTEEGLSLEATDTLRFTTDEGSWLSLDVTPDGQPLISPEWMPDGRNVVVTRRRGRNAHLRLYHVNGGSGVGIGDGLRRPT